jgi:hypothetical protein
MRGQDATLERLRVDRQLEEALTHGRDPLHLAEVFGLDEKTAMCYADSARVLLEQATESGFSPWKPERSAAGRDDHAQGSVAVNPVFTAAVVDTSPRPHNCPNAVLL